MIIEGHSFCEQMLFVFARDGVKHISFSLLLDLYKFHCLLGTLANPPPSATKAPCQIIAELHRCVGSPHYPASCQNQYRAHNVVIPKSPVVIPDSADLLSEISLRLLSDNPVSQ